MTNCDSKQSESGFRGHSDAMDVDALASLAASTGKGKGLTPPDCCFKCGGHRSQ